MVFLAGAWGLMFAIEKTKESAAGVFVLLGFTFFMGLMLARLLGAVLGFANGGELIMLAFAGTGAVFFGMASLSSVIKRDLSSLGKWLFIGAVMLFVGFLPNFFIQSGPLMLTLVVLDRHLLGFHPVRPEAGARRRGDQLHLSNAGRVPEPLQRVPELAGAARIFSGERE
jgi:hypothetical protein